MKNAEKSPLEKITEKSSKNESHKLYNSLIKPDVDTFLKSTGRGRNKSMNILNVLNNKESSVFDSLYLHYSDKPSELEKVLQKKQN